MRKIFLIAMSTILFLCSCGAPQDKNDQSPNIYRKATSQEMSLAVTFLPEGWSFSSPIVVDIGQKYLFAEAVKYDKGGGKSERFMAFRIDGDLVLDVYDSLPSRFRIVDDSGISKNHETKYKVETDLFPEDGKPVQELDGGVHVPVCWTDDDYPATWSPVYIIRNDKVVSLPMWPKVLQTVVGPAKIGEENVLVSIELESLTRISASSEEPIYVPAIYAPAIDRVMKKKDGIWVDACEEFQSYGQKKADEILDTPNGELDFENLRKVYLYGLVYGFKDEAIRKIESRIESDPNLKNNPLGKDRVFIKKITSEDDYQPIYPGREEARLFLQPDPKRMETFKLSIDKKYVVEAVRMADDKTLFAIASTQGNDGQQEKALFFASFAGDLIASLYKTSISGLTTFGFMEGADLWGYEGLAPFPVYPVGINEIGDFEHSRSIVFKIEDGKPVQVPFEFEKGEVARGVKVVGERAYIYAISEHFGSPFGIAYKDRLMEYSGDSFREIWPILSSMQGKAVSDDYEKNGLELLIDAKKALLSKEELTDYYSYYSAIDAWFCFETGMSIDIHGQNIIDFMKTLQNKRNFDQASEMATKMQGALKTSKKLTEVWGEEQLEYPPVSWEKIK